MEKVNNTEFSIAAFYSSLNKDVERSKDDQKGDELQISNTSKVFNKLDNFLNLGKSGRLDVGDLNDEEKNEFYKMLSDLIKANIVGYEVLEINGKPEKHYVVNQIGDKRTYGAKLYTKKSYHK